MIKPLGELVVKKEIAIHNKRVKHAFTKYENQRKLAEKLKKKYEPDDEFLAIEVNRVMNL